MSIRRRGIGRLARRNAERRFGVFGCIADLLDLAVQSAAPQKRIVFFLLQPVRRARAFLVAACHVTRRRFPERFSFRAFKGDNLLRHNTRSLLHFRRSGFLLLRLSPLLFGQAKQGSD